LVELSGFGYLPGNSVLHRLDVRTKMVCLVLVGLAALSASWGTLALLTILPVWSAWHIRLPLSSISMETRYVMLLLLVVFAARIFTTPGSVLWQFSMMSITREGLQAGALVCWRLVVVIAAGLVFVATTRPTEITAAVAWFLKPIPGVPEKRAATMISLMVRFIPLILNQARETAAAQRARCLDARKNPLVKMTKLTVPMIRRTFETADRLTVAMDARCYNENRTPRALSASTRDWAALVLVSCLAVLVVIL
jgi:energy-coupling factor transporter transmembrane protein EcfT